MTESEIIKVTSKGQITIPSQFRKELSLGKDSYLFVARAGKLLVLKKVDEISLDEIADVLGGVAEREGITRDMIAEDAKKARKAFLDEMLE